MKRDNQLECGNSFVDDSTITSAYHRCVKYQHRQVQQVVESVVTLTSSTRVSVKIFITAFQMDIFNLKTAFINSAYT